MFSIQEVHPLLNVTSDFVVAHPKQDRCAFARNLLGELIVFLHRPFVYSFSSWEQLAWQRRTNTIWLRQLYQPKFNEIYTCAVVLTLDRLCWTVHDSTYDVSHLARDMFPFFFLESCDSISSIRGSGFMGMKLAPQSADGSFSLVACAWVTGKGPTECWPLRLRVLANKLL